MELCHSGGFASNLISLNVIKILNRRARLDVFIRAAGESVPFFPSAVPTLRKGDDRRFPTCVCDVVPFNRHKKAMRLTHVVVR